MVTIQANSNAPRPRGVDLLLTRPITTIPDLQLANYTREGLRTRFVRDWNPQNAIGLLKQAEGKMALTIDMGGDKITARPVTIVNGAIRASTDPLTEKNKDNGASYLLFLEGYAAASGPVGIATAGLVNGTKLRESPNIPAFVDHLITNYDGDLAAIFPESPHVAVANDAVAGLIAASVEATKQNPNVKKVLYLINGGGIGGAVWQESHIVSTEPGHVAIINELNPFSKREACGMEGSTFTCPEKIGASGAGIQTSYEQQTGKQLDGREISKLYQQGDTLALDLYDNAARITATAIVGLDRGTSEITTQYLDPASTIVVCHGGIFYVPGFQERMEAILQKHLGYKPNILYTKDFTKDTTENACLDGVGILALT